MDQKQAAVLEINLETDNRLTVLCEGLDQFSTGCKEVVERFSECKSHHYVHNLVAIHIKSMAGEDKINSPLRIFSEIISSIPIIFAELLSQLNPGMDLQSCEVFRRPKSPLLVHHIEHSATQLPLTSNASLHSLHLTIIATISALLMISR